LVNAEHFRNDNALSKLSDLPTTRHAQCADFGDFAISNAMAAAAMKKIYSVDVQMTDSLKNVFFCYI
jgi:hypothetical protein